MRSSIENVQGSPSGIELAMTSPSGVQPVKLMITLSRGPGCVVPFAFDRTFQANPLAVLVAWGGASATSAGAAGATGRVLPSGSIGWDTAIGPTNRVARTVVTATTRGRA